MRKCSSTSSISRVAVCTQDGRPVPRVFDGTGVVAIDDAAHVVRSSCCGDEVVDLAAAVDQVQLAVLVLAEGGRIETRIAQIRGVGVARGDGGVRVERP